MSIKSLVRVLDIRRNNQGVWGTTPPLKVPRIFWEVRSQGNQESIGHLS
jgi:hypothetical protein